MNKTTSLLDQIMENDEDIRAKFRAMPTAVVTSKPLTLKEQANHDSRMRYKPWTLTGEHDSDLVSVMVVE